MNLTKLLTCLTLLKFKAVYMKLVCAHKETSQLICSKNQLTGFYIRTSLLVNRLKRIRGMLRRFPSAFILVEVGFNIFFGRFCWCNYRILKKKRTGNQKYMSATLMITDQKLSLTIQLKRRPKHSLLCQ